MSLEFELAYFNALAQYFGHYAKRTPIHLWCCAQSFWSLTQPRHIYKNQSDCNLGSWAARLLRICGHRSFLAAKIGFSWLFSMLQCHVAKFKVFQQPPKSALSSPVPIYRPLCWFWGHVGKWMEALSQHHKWPPQTSWCILGVWFSFSKWHQHLLNVPIGTSSINSNQYSMPFPNFWRSEWYYFAFLAESTQLTLVCCTVDKIWNKLRAYTKLII